MYQMLTGILPYDTPAPADLDKLMSGELVTPPRMKNPAIPREVNDIVMRALAPDVAVRYQRAADLLEAVLAVRTAPRPRRTPLDGLAAADRPGRDERSPSGVRSRDAVSAKFCWQCRKPLHARNDRCPFCGESQ
jgi:serine/threonine protein kinase